MKVVRAEAMGMCFGVRDALAALNEISSPQSTAIYGELVHNEQVAQAIRLRGFESVSENARHHLPERSEVVITAHGISDSDRTRLLAAGKTLIDTTCPLVRRVHETACRLQQNGWFIIVIGKKDHVEVLGITGDLQHYAVVQTPDEVGLFPHSQIAVICQTTTRPHDAEAITHAIRDANPDSTVRFVDTICRPTRDRQLAAEKLVCIVDALVVVGGRHSNNTRQLVHLAQQHGLPVTHVQSAADIVPEWFSPFSTIGLTAGTSTLPATIDEVCAMLEALTITESHPIAC